MKQLFQGLKSGEVVLESVPAPAASPGCVVVQTRRSLVSMGTERMLLNFGRSGLLGKARQQPDKVRQVLDKVRTDGLIATLETVRSKLDEPMPLGYCSVGTVIEVGRDITDIPLGARVACNGKHAEIVSVPRNLCALIPDSVSDDAAAFTVLGAIALQGIRLAEPTLGEAIVVTGLGLIGLLTVQLLRAQGCRVLGLDFDAGRLELARRFGAEVLDLKIGSDLLAVAHRFSRGRGVDAVLITAATQSSEPVHQAAQMCRKRGRIVLVGVTGLDLSRADFFQKELTFQVSCSYGPGRYDVEYEERGRDYPVGFVRWTEQRNFEAVLDMLVDGRLEVGQLISHRFVLERAPEAYDLIARGEACLGIVIEYANHSQPLTEPIQRTVRVSSQRASPVGRVAIGFVGSGSYARGVLMPAFRHAGAGLRRVTSNMGASGVHAASKHGIEFASTEAESVIGAADVDAVVIATRHDTHARYVIDALRAGKHVFVEKPLALTLKEISEIAVARELASHLTNGPPLVMVGFNRRFAPHIVKIRSLLEHRTGPKSFVMTVNAGGIPNDHWTRDLGVGGGRIIGEACHFIDLLRFLSGARIASARAIAQGSTTLQREDRAHIVLTFEDDSTGVIHYLANGHRSFPKERLEVFCGGAMLQLENFRKLRGYGWPGFSRFTLFRQDKGQRNCVAAFVSAVQHGGEAPIAFDELVEVAEHTIALAESLRTG
jgi:predicted dehydrogenase/threonine dehydrogenase-like Zn-dependent dehydrogenase